jgi:predicted Ser/Thr protein kinase
VGRYELIAKLGEGGMGVVHLARGPDGQRVAVKLLRDHVVGDEEGRSRLAREVTTLRRVRSPYVAEVHDADPWGDRPFVVTRYVPGQSLHDHVREEGPLDEADLRHLARGLAEAMVAVHEAGVLHRDIKPSNVLLEGRAPVLIDFGLAKLADDSRLTATGWLMGTPGYLAPEILYGDDPTPASDVHAWAATVCYAAAGSSPYGGGPAMAVMDRARRGEYDVSALPSDLQPLVERCLSADPAARPHGPELVDLLSRPGARTFAPPAPPPPVPATRPLTVPVANENAPPLRRPDPAPESEPLPSPRSEVHPAPRPAHAAHPGLLTALRTAMTVGLGVLVAALVGLAPYVGAVVVFVVVWLVRTASVSGDALLRRRSARGPRRSDGVVRTVAWPWHLVVGMWGSLALVLVGLVAAAAVAALATMVGQPEWRALVMGGGVLALCLWWGPGSTRLRNQTRRAVWRVAVPSQTGVAGLLAVWVLAIVLFVVRLRAGVLWYPESAAPLPKLGLF